MNNERKRAPSLYLQRVSISFKVNLRSLALLRTLLEQTNEMQQGCMQTETAEPLIEEKSFYFKQSYEINKNYCS
jgi:hypothetical protein